MEEYVMFLDESGDHDLKKVDKNFPVFCLAGVIFEKEYYKHIARPKIDAVKNRFWGHADVIFHSRDIRKREGDFYILMDDEIREDFYDSINSIMDELEFTIIAIVIDKEKHIKRYQEKAEHPYNFALELIMERYSRFLERQGFSSGYILAESRGRKEDELLENVFEWLFGWGNYYNGPLHNISNIGFKKKIENINGLQLADLIAYPIARKVINPEQDYKAFNILKNKFHSNGYNQIIGCGLKIFPNQTGFEKIFK